jgi:hypothetical protein|nr:MAG TPA: hypothetical protein [Caudoviricetes sp.]
MSLDLPDGIALIRKAQEKERDERIFLQWAIQLPVMAVGDKQISFDDYKAHVTGADIDRRPVSEIMAELDDVERQFQREEEKNGA